MILALGISNSGKSFTIIGDKQDQGIFKKTLQTLFELKDSIENKEVKKNSSFTKNQEIKEMIFNSGIFDFKDFDVSIEAFEIYNEEIIDLISDERFNKKPEVLEINKKIYVQSLFYK